MRITGGLARGIPLRLPARGEIRPATDYLREAVFSSLGAFVEGARVLDLFSGTGAYGLEALSRGSGAVTFVEKNPAAIAAVRANASAVQKAILSAASHGKKPAAPCADAAPPLPRANPAPAPACDFIQQDALRWAPPTEETYDLLFCDPPWRLWEDEAASIPEKLAHWARTGPDSRIILEGPAEWQPRLPPAWREHRRLAKGKGQPSAILLRPA
ncbi:MAG: RsmD family RNA methyltransferase [Puniceicoccales bacterium]|jgi:16S rRNA (guanine966-N2)-methyltransferase|nr:RsmD family RNA methyltransferase [Puniceicoccales bacterium]